MEVDPLFVARGDPGNRPVVTERGIQPVSDMELIERAKGLESSAWAEIYQRHFPSIYGFVYRRVGDQVTSEDLASGVFLTALERINTFSYRGTPLVAWLFRIAHNQVVDYWRRRARMTKSSLESNEGDTQFSGKDEVELSLLKEDLRAALRYLTGDQRQVLLLKFIDGLSNQEIAQVLKKPEGAIKSLQHRGLASMRRYLDRGEGYG